MLPKIKIVTLNILNGLSIGIVVALVPGAILNTIVRLLLPTFPSLSIITYMTATAITLLPALAAVCVGMLAHFTPIQTCSLALAAIIGAGNYHLTKAGVSVTGSGDVINIAITLAVGYGLVIVFKDKLKAYTILLLPSLMLVIAGGVGLLTLKPVSKITTYVGILIQNLTHLQPLIMGTLVAIIFAVLVVSPISSVGIATAISLEGVSAGSANLGIVGASFALAIYGWPVNSPGTSFAHFLGTPKIQMANIMPHPKLLLPMSLNAAILGGIGALLNIQGTPASSGFGFSGLIGPLAALDKMSSMSTFHIFELISVFFILPVGLGVISNMIFTNLLHYQKPEDYALHYD